MTFTKTALPFCNQKYFHICFIINIYFNFMSISVQSPPKIIKEPPTDELLFQVKSKPSDNDKPFIIECEAEGEPAPS